MEKPAPERLAFAIGLLLTMLAGPSLAGSLELLRDINTQTIAVDSSPRYLGAVNGRVIFTAEAGLNVSTTLFASDGTPQGTQPIGSVGGDDGRQYPFPLGQQLLYFVDQNLWKTDGTAAGTSLLAAVGNVFRPPWLGVASGYALFVSTSEGGLALWRTDGTSNGTTKVFQFSQGTSQLASPSAAIGSRLYFLVRSSEHEVWETDGSASGTRLVYRPLQGSFDGPDQIAAFQQQLVVQLYDEVQQRPGLYLLDPGTGNLLQLTSAITEEVELANALDTGTRLIIPAGRGLWATDGTPGGTVLLADRLGSDESGSRKFWLLNDRVFFVNSDSVSQQELWVTDGTVAGTSIFFEFTPGVSGTAEIVATTRSHAYIVARDAPPNNSVHRLWITDGTAPGTRVVPLANGVASVGNDDFQGHVAGENVFVTGRIDGLSDDPRYSIIRAALDGSGAQRVFDHAIIEQSFAAIDRLFFASSTATTGIEPWVSDGTVAGTQLLRDLAHAPTNGHSSPQSFATLEGITLFAADDGVHGMELWKTDGTDAGTVLVKDIAAGSEASTPQHLTAVNGLVYFLATTAGADTSVWRSDGTAAGTFSLGDSTNRLSFTSNSGCRTWIAALGDRVVFPARFDVHEYGLWSSDGTAQGTQRFSDLSLRPSNPGGACHLATVGSRVLMTLHESGFQRQLWSTDGTDAGTGMVKLINPDAAAFGTTPARLFVTLQGVAYFSADDGTRQSLWRSDGTDAGTYQVGGSTIPEFVRSELTVLKGRIVFFGADRPGSEWSVYSTNGTASGTRLLRGGFGLIGDPAGGSERVFFVGGIPDPGAPGRTIDSVWSTDGTAAGTRAGRRIRSIGAPLVHDDVLFFIGWDEASGSELWTSDGTTFGTRLVGDLAPGLASGALRFSLLRGQPLISGDSDAYGQELYTLRNQPPSAVDDASTATSGTVITLDVNANDLDPDGVVALASARVTSGPSHGTATEAEDGKIRYQPYPGFTGTDSFDYILTDTEGGSSAPARVTVRVTAASGSSGGGGIDWEVVAALLGAAFVRLRTMRFRTRVSHV